MNGKLKDIIKNIQAIEKRFEQHKVIYSADIIPSQLVETKKRNTKTSTKQLSFDFIEYVTDHQAIREAGIHRLHDLSERLARLPKLLDKSERDW